MADNERGAGDERGASGERLEDERVPSARLGDERLERQIRFFLELDRLKTVVRRNYLADGSRLENDAEHSWHLAAMAVIFAEYAEGPVDLLRVLKMLLVHDIVEIDAGDTFLYDPEAVRDKALRETRAADRIFALLPPDQASELRDLWEEFEARESGDARFARALDRLQPLFLNYSSQGRSWKEHGISRDQVERANRISEEGSPRLWQYARGIIEEATRRGYLRP